MQRRKGRGEHEQTDNQNRFTCFVCPVRNRIDHQLYRILAELIERQALVKGSSIKVVPAAGFSGKAGRGTPSMAFTVFFGHDALGLPKDA